MLNLTEKILPVGSQLTHGAVAFINESDLMQGTYSVPLTAYVSGNPENNDLRAAIDFIAPGVEVSQRFEFKKAADDAYYADIDGDDEVAVGGTFKKIESKLETVQARTKNYGLTTVIVHDRVSGIPMWKERAAQSLRNRCLRNSYLRIITAVSDAAHSTGYTWDASAGKDADADLMAEYMETITAKGIPPNRVLFGMVAWAKRKRSVRAQTSAGGFGSAGMTPEDLAGWLGVDEVRVAKEVYNTSASVKAKIVPDIVLMFNARPVVSVDDPSNIKRFWSRCEDGKEDRVYIQEGVKSTQIWYEHYEFPVVIQSPGLRKLVIS